MGGLLGSKGYVGPPLKLLRGLRPRPPLPTPMMVTYLWRHWYLLRQTMHAMPCSATIKVRCYLKFVQWKTVFFSKCKSFPNNFILCLFCLSYLPWSNGQPTALSYQLIWHYAPTCRIFPLACRDCGLLSSWRTAVSKFWFTTYEIDKIIGKLAD